MKLHYILLLLWAVFITGLADGISMALTAIPLFGFVLALAITFCINITMGAGLILALASFDMYHPRIGPFAIIGGLLPGLNFLPFWVGLVVAGILYKMNSEGENLSGVAGAALQLQSAYQSGGNPLAVARTAAGVVMNERRATGRPPQAVQEPEAQKEEGTPRTLSNLKSPRNTAGMDSDIAPARNQPYAKAA